MASVGVAAEQPSSTEVFPWLKTLPVAPEYHPTLAEFEDPIGYIFKIEKEASKYGICKIIPPVPAPPKKTTIANLNRSLAARSGDSNPKSAPTFTTRQQQIGFCPRKQRPVQKPVWQSGENYTVPEFEAKAKSFEKNYSRKSSKRGLTSLEVETLYWKATVDKPFSVEYANDMPGSAFVPVGAKKSRGVGEPVTLAETAWNMRGVSRAKGSLLRFMKEEIPGVTSPMVYIAMMFSWFAWHVEDHDLHSLNYLHMGAGKTWYGVPREAAVAFEEVIRVHGYGGEINPLVTFATLGEKTTVMSPEVLLNAGVPCCRLVQNAGEFVVTFPRAYHSGFSHGFNCAEAANIATPGWLTVAKEAAVRRASINCPPMVSHVQLLYDLAISLCSRVPNRMNNEPRSSRLKDKKKSECETFVKQLFVQDVIHHNDLLYFLSNKSSAVVILPRNCVDNFSSSYNKLNAKKGLDSYSIGKRLPSDVDSQTKNNNNKVSNEGGGGGEVSPTDNRLSDQKLFSCVTCGILCFACVAIIQPTDTSARLFMSADRSFFSDSGIAGDGFKGVELEGGSQQETFSGHSGWTVNNNRDGLYEVPVQSSTDQIPATNQRLRPVSNNDVNNVSSSLNLLALNYGDSSDSEEELIEAEIPITEKNEVEIDGEEKRTFECRVEFETDSPVGSMPSNSSSWSRELPEVALSSSLRAHKNTVFPKSDEDSSRMHVFCLEHAVEVEQQLRQFGGSRLMLLCHPDYPKVEAEAKTVAEEVRTDYEWNDVPFRDATAGDEDKIRSALDGEEAMHGNGDWAVKLGINLYYSANLSRSPLYSKQMPYNFIIYAAFGRNSKPESHRKTPSGRQRKITVAGKWCGKVWMSNQVHPLLAERYPEDDEEEEEIERESIDQNGKKSRKSIVESKSFRRARSPKEEEEENEINIETASINRTGKKRGKSTVESESFRRAKSPVEEEEEEDRIKDSGDRTPAPMSSFQQYYRRKPIKKEIVPLKVVNWGREPKEFINPPLLPSVAEEPEEGGPSTRLRKRTSKTPKQAEHKSVSKRPINPKPKKVPPAKVIMKNTRMNISEEEEEEEEEQEEEEHEHEQEEIYACEMEGCNMSFRSKQELLLHKRNICPVKGCGKKFFSHKYLVQHRRVHMDDRPLKCPWRGCKMTFKWAWARTEHIRVHTGARPYICTESGCGQTFRFVSDFSRHKRKTGHSRKKGKKG